MNDVMVVRSMKEDFLLIPISPSISLFITSTSVEIRGDMHAVKLTPAHLACLVWSASAGKSTYSLPSQIHILRY